MENNNDILATPEEGSSILTDEQIHEVYASLAPEDEASFNALAAAVEETESTQYEGLEEIENFNIETAETVVPEDVLKESIRQYGFNIIDEEISDVASLAMEYKLNKDTKVYNRLPESMQQMVKRMQFQAGAKNSVASREVVAKMLFDSFLSDAELDMAIDTFNSEIKEAYDTMNGELSKLFTEAYDEVFNSIDDIAKEDPEKAERIRSIKNAFDKASNFDIQMEYLNSGKINKKVFKKRVMRFNDEVFYFNKKVNENPNGIKIQDVKSLLDALQIIIPGRREDEYKSFIILIIRSIVYNQEVIDINALEWSAYIYRFIDNIYKYKILPTMCNDNPEEYKAIYDAISLVMDKIKSL